MSPDRANDPAELALGLAFVAILVTVTVTDLKQRVIPNRILLAGAVAGLAIVAPTDPGSLPARAIAAAAAGGFLLIGATSRRGGMGMGDVKLASLMGLYLGPAVALALVVAFAAGALIGAGLMLRHGAGARERLLPFGPLLAVGGIAGLWWGDDVGDWYLDSFVA